MCSVESATEHLRRSVIGGLTEPRHATSVAVEVFVGPGCELTAARRIIGGELEARGVPLRALSTVEDPWSLRDPVRVRCEFDDGRTAAEPGRVRGKGVPT